MRILHVIPSVGEAHGGPTLAVRLMARASAIAGDTAHIATTNINAGQLMSVQIADMIEHEGVQTIFFPPGSRTYTYSRGLAEWLGSHVADYDVVHTHALFTHATVAASRACRAHAVPCIVRPLGTLAAYGMAQHRFMKAVSWRLFEKRILQRARAVHFTSAAERDEAARLGGGWRSEVVPLGIDTALYKQDRDKSAVADVLPQAQDRLVLLFLSRLHPKKRPELLLRAVAGLHESVAPLVIMAGTGEPAYEARLKQLAHELHIQDDVYWAGHVAGTDKERVLRAADVFVLPSVNENFGIAVVEALASGLPVIVSDGVAIHGEIAAHQAGIVISNDLDSLARAIETLTNARERAAMALRARSLAENVFSLEAMSAGLQNMYRRAVS